MYSLCVPPRAGGAVHGEPDGVAMAVLDARAHSLPVPGGWGRVDQSYRSGCGAHRCGDWELPDCLAPPRPVRGRDLVDEPLGRRPRQPSLALCAIEFLEEHLLVVPSDTEGVAVDPECRLVPCDEGLEVRGEGWVEGAPVEPRRDGARRRRMVGDDHRGGAIALGIGEFGLDERALLPRCDPWRVSRTTRCVSATYSVEERGKRGPSWTRPPADATERIPLRFLVIDIFVSETIFSATQR